MPYNIKWTVRFWVLKPFNTRWNESIQMFPLIFIFGLFNLLLDLGSKAGFIYIYFLFSGVYFVPALNQAYVLFGGKLCYAKCKRLFKVSGYWE